MAVNNGLALIIFMASAPLFASCGDDDDNAPDASTDADSDADTDADGGTDTGTETDTGPGDKAVWVSAGGSHTCAVIEGGYVKCWGDWQFGRLGYGPDCVNDTDADGSLPSTLPFVRVGGEVAEVEAGGYHTCALLADGTAKCWGYDAQGQLGVDTGDYWDSIGVYDVPADYDPIDFGGEAVARIVAAEGNFTIALLEGGGVSCLGACWGDQGGVDLGAGATDVCAGWNHTCAVVGDSDVYCWGDGQYGALGYGATDDIWIPLEAGPVDVGGAAVQVACGDYHTCALLDTGDVVCWGDGQYGALGYGNTVTIGDDELPADVGPVNVGAAVKQISAGGSFTCAVLESGLVKCWGAIAYGLGYVVGDDETPASVGPVDVGGPVSRIDGGAYHVCALMETGAARCWGNGDSGELGYGPGVTYVGDDESPASMGDVPLL
jgi:alpha-tubulin suppressor-like RCC1 family protein